MKIEGPFLEACAECWQPVLDGVPRCDCAGGVHRWQATRGFFVVAHPAIPTPFAGEFAYPIDDRLVVRFWARHRRVLRRMAVDPNVAKVRWYVEVDPTVPPGLVPAEVLVG